MVLGPAGCGKTTVWKTLMACHNRGKAKPTTVTETVNPKVQEKNRGCAYLVKSSTNYICGIVIQHRRK